MEELKQEIVIVVTEKDFKRHNPDIDIDEMRLHNFAEQLMRVVQNRLDSLDERYHTCISTEPAKSPWIRITPETKIETEKAYLTFNGCTCPEVLTYRGDGLWADGIRNYNNITHYQPITLPEEN